MLAQVTDGVKVSVYTEFQPEYLNANQGHFVFTYKITIENNSRFTIQLQNGIGKLLIFWELIVRWKEMVL